MKISLKDIYIEFLQIGIQLLGGGYVIIPLMKRNIIDKRKWITDRDLSEYYALSQSIPGIIAANISAFTGYKLNGAKGAAAAILGIITTPIISIIGIAIILNKLLQISFIQSIFWGASISVIILIYLSIKEIWRNSISDIFSFLIYVITIILSLSFSLSPAKIIFITLFIGMFYKIIKKQRENL
ncbi:chromate transporter [bacterium]|nr:chromate transporter [bacterium]